MKSDNSFDPFNTTRNEKQVLDVKKENSVVKEKTMKTHHVRKTNQADEVAKFYIFWWSRSIPIESSTWESGMFGVVGLNE